MENKTLFNKDTKGCLQETVILKPITLFAYKMEMHILGFNPHVWVVIRVVVQGTLLWRWA